MINYSNGKVYMIRPIAEHEEGEVYIGSTTKHYLSDRLFNHRNMYEAYKVGRGQGRYTVYDLFDKYGSYNCAIYLIEEVNANSKAELFAREGYHITVTKCVNKLFPIRTREEYLERKKQYKIENQAKINKYNISRKEKANCVCGGKYTLDSQHRHKKSILHCLRTNRLIPYD